MVWFRMVWIAARLAWPHLLMPWRSPLVRWRMETYGLLGDDGQPLHADDVTASRFFQFACHHRRALARFLRWASCL